VPPSPADQGQHGAVQRDVEKRRPGEDRHVDGERQTVECVRGAPEPLQALFAGAGLTGVTIEPIVVPTVFADVDDYSFPFLLGQGPAPSYVATLPEDHRAALRERLREMLTPDGDGAIRLTARAWAVRGTNA
jgi:hypothetical protein